MFNIKEESRIWLLKHKPSRADQIRAERRAEATRPGRAAERAAKRAKRIKRRGGAIGSSTSIAAERAPAVSPKPKVTTRRRPMQGVVARETQAQFKAFQAREQLKAAPALLAAFNKKVADQRAASAKKQEQAVKKQAQAALVVRLRDQKRIDDKKSRSARFKAPAITGPTTFEDDAPDTGPAFSRVKPGVKPRSTKPISTPSPRLEGGKRASTRGKVAGLASLSLVSATSAIEKTEQVGRAIFRPRDEGRGRQSLGTEVMSDADLAKAFVAGRITGQQLRDTGRDLSAPTLVLSPAESQRFGRETRRAKQVENLTIAVARASSSLQEIEAERRTQSFSAKKFFGVEPPEVTKAKEALNRQIGKDLIRLEKLGAADRKDVIKFLVDTEQFKLAAKFPSTETRSAVESFRARRADDTALSILGPIIPAGAIIKGGFAAIGGQKLLTATGARFVPGAIARTVIPKLRIIPALARRPFSRLKFRPTKPKLTDEALDVIQARAARGASEVAEDVLQTSRARAAVREVEELLKSTRGKPTRAPRTGRGVKESPGEAALSEARRVRIAAEEAARGSPSAAKLPTKSRSWKDIFGGAAKPFRVGAQKTGTIALKTTKIGAKVAGRTIRSPLGLVGGGLAAVVGGGLILEGLKGAPAAPPQQAPSPAAPAAPQDTRRRQRQQQQSPAQAAQAAPAPARGPARVTTVTPITAPSTVVIDEGETQVPSRTPSVTTPDKAAQTIEVPTIGPDGKPIIDPITKEVVTVTVDIVDAPFVKDEPDTSLVPVVAPIVAAAAGIVTGLLSRGRGGATSSQSFFGGSSSFIGPTIFRTAEGQTGIRIVKDGKGTITLEVERVPVKRFTILGRPLVKRPTRILGASVQSKAMASAGQSLLKPPVIGSTTVLAGRVLQGRLR